MIESYRGILFPRNIPQRPACKLRLRLKDSLEMPRTKDTQSTLHKETNFFEPSSSLSRTPVKKMKKLVDSIDNWETEVLKGEKRSFILSSIQRKKELLIENGWRKNGKNHPEVDLNRLLNSIMRTPSGKNPNGI